MAPVTRSSISLLHAGISTVILPTTVMSSANVYMALEQCLVTVMDVKTVEYAVTANIQPCDAAMLMEEGMHLCL